MRPFTIAIRVHRRLRKPGVKALRAATLGNVILYNGELTPYFLAHELIHVEQGVRQPFVMPLLNAYYNTRYGYWKNPYELEAYRRVPPPATAPTTDKPTP